MPLISAFWFCIFFPWFPNSGKTKCVDHRRISRICVGDVCSWLSDAKKLNPRACRNSVRTRVCQIELSILLFFSFPFRSRQVSLFWRLFMRKCVATKKSDFWFADSVSFAWVVVIKSSCQMNTPNILYALVSNYNLCKVKLISDFLVSSCEIVTSHSCEREKHYTAIQHPRLCKREKNQGVYFRTCKPWAKNIFAGLLCDADNIPWKEEGRLILTPQRSLSSFAERTKSILMKYATVGRDSIPLKTENFWIWCHFP